MMSSAINKIQVDPAAASLKYHNNNGPGQNKSQLQPKTKELVYKAYKYFKQQKRNKDSLEYKTDANISKLVALATCIKLGTVNRIISEGNKAVYKTRGATLFDQKETEAKLSANYYRHFRLGHIRKIIYQMYTVDKVYPSLKKLSAALKQNDIINCGREVLRRLLFKIGYYYEKNHKRSILLERADITEKRFNYLINILKCRSNDNNNIFFIGETKIDPVVYRDVGKGCGLNVIVAGNRNGLIADSAEIYGSDEDITTTMFHKWVEHKLKNKLPLNSVVIMSSESYHCMPGRKIPTADNLKHEMHEWLHEHGLHFAPDMCKVELLKIINSNSSQIQYKVHEMLQGHTVLYVPPFHTDLNPLWLVLEDVKEVLFRECILTLEEKSKMLKRLISEYPADKCQKYDNIISGNEREYWSYDMKMDEALDEIFQSIRGGAPGADSSDSDNGGEDVDSAISDEDNSK